MSPVLAVELEDVAEMQTRYRFAWMTTGMTNVPDTGSPKKRPSPPAGQHAGHRHSRRAPVPAQTRVSLQPWPISCSLLLAAGEAIPQSAQA
jgi:hypothetical protein